MIFTNISNITDKTNKAFFVEKVLLYTRIIECLSGKLLSEYAAISEIQDEIINELKNIGVILNAEELPLLRKTLTPNVYSRFIHAVEEFVISPKFYLPWVTKLRNSSREECIADVPQNAPTIADFFCGAGGMSMGFCKAGFNVLLANDIVDECIETYRFNHPEIPTENVVKADIRELCEYVDKYISKSVDIVVGGPPCQGFSSANQQRIINDPRNELYKYFLKAIESIAPKFVVMENVKGMLSVADQVVEDYGNIKVMVNGTEQHYIVSCQLVNSADFGVAQNRIRLIYIAIRSDIAAEKDLSPQKIFDKIAEEKQEKPFVLKSALEFIKPLSSPRIKGLTEVDDELTGKKVDANTFKSTNKYIELINSNKKVPLVFNHKARYANDTNFQIFSLLKQGEDASSERIKGIMPYSHRLHCFKDKYFRLYEDRPCRTITAHLRMDCLSHIHPTQTRTITPREAARVQSFPDDYVFLGAYLKTYMQIGNAVPVLLANKIANVIKQYI